MEEQKKIIKELKDIGIEVEDIYDLVNTKNPYPGAIPVLIRYLKKGIEDPKLKQGILRALAVPEAKGKIGSLLIEEFYKIPADNMLLRWVIGNTMEVVITNEDIDEVAKIVSDKKNGMSRQMFVLALGKITSKKSEDVLIQVLDDEEITPHALEALGKLKSRKAKGKIMELTKHPKALIRKEANKALKKIG